ncbi:hypothetical protein Bbelb_337210 [Branchiostoma belcheri]|nr:hypothetical protein Bbelb_337210 [Branchiostoma belcheri]
MSQPQPKCQDFSREVSVERHRTAGLVFRNVLVRGGISRLHLCGVSVSDSSVRVCQPPGALWGALPWENHWRVRPLARGGHGSQALFEDARARPATARGPYQTDTPRADVKVLRVTRERVSGVTSRDQRYNHNTSGVGWAYLRQTHARPGGGEGDRPGRGDGPSDVRNTSGRSPNSVRTRTVASLWCQTCDSDHLPADNHHNGGFGV